MTAVWIAAGVILLAVILYFLAIMPRINGRPDYSPLCGWYYAHRGLHDNKSDAPENSMAAFKKAVENGYGIELDVQLTKDGLPVVCHDFSLKRNCGVEGKVSDYNYEELKKFTLFDSEEHIPLFREVLELVNGRVPIIVEIKMENANCRVCGIADELLRAYKGKYCVESFHPFAVRWYKKNRPDVIRGQLSSHFGREGNTNFFMWFVQNLLSNFLTKPDFIAYNWQYESVPARRLCRKLYHCLSVAWTIKSQEQLDKSRDKFDLFIFEGFIPKD